MADEASDRCYHGNALLLPNGRVLSLGGGEGGAGPWAELNPVKSNLTDAQLFSPPYLAGVPRDDKSGRPTVSGMPDKVDYGKAIPITITSNDSIARVSWIRLGSVTHAMKMSQAVWFQIFTPVATKQLTMEVPTNRNILPPGHYMVIFVNSAGAPSIAPIVQILPTKATNPPAPLKPAESSALKGAPQPVKSKRMAKTLSEMDKHMKAEQNRPPVAIGVVPVCPYDLGPCLGGAAEGLNAIDHLTDDKILPDIDVWRNEFARTANGSYGIRGIELAISGVVAKKPADTSGEEVLTLSNKQSGLDVTLAPFKVSSQIRWDMGTQSPRPVPEAELGSYAALSAAVEGGKGINVRVTGRLNKLDHKSFSLDVREFEIVDDATAG